MKSTLKSLSMLLLSIVFVFCSKPKQEEGETATTEDPNQVLYNQVMDVHDEVMPKMEEMYSLKKQLKEKITNSADIPAEKLKEMESTVLFLDSASKAMMVWMREFKPDSLQGEELREYLESEMERVKKVKEIMLESIEKGKQANQ